MPARLDPPHRVGPRPDTQQRPQRHTSREHTPFTSPSGEGPPSRPEPPGTVGIGYRTDPLHRPPRRWPPHPRRPPPPHATDSDHPPPEVWCTVLGRGHYYVVAATATSPGPQLFVKGTDTMLAAGAAPPGAVGDPTTPHKVLRGVLQPEDKATDRALAQITSGRAGYHLGLAMLCLTQWIKRSRQAPTRGQTPPPGLNNPSPAGTTHPQGPPPHRP